MDTEQRLHPQEPYPSEEEVFLRYMAFGRSLSRLFFFLTYCNDDVSLHTYVFLPCVFTNVVRLG